MQVWAWLKYCKNNFLWNILVIICLWGSIFVEYWKREESHLAYEWDTEDYEKMELDRVEYSQKLQAYRIKVKNPSAEFPDYKRYLKYLVSLVVSLFMVIIFKRSNQTLYFKPLILIDRNCCYWHSIGCCISFMDYENSVPNRWKYWSNESR